jgi:hypothetical protein
MRRGAAQRNYYKYGGITDALLPQLAQLLNQPWREPEALHEAIKKELLLASAIERL